MGANGSPETVGDVGGVSRFGVADCPVHCSTWASEIDARSVEMPFLAASDVGSDGDSDLAREVIASGSSNSPGLPVGASWSSLQCAWPVDVDWPVNFGGCRARIDACSAEIGAIVPTVLGDDDVEVLPREAVIAFGLGPVCSAGMVLRVGSCSPSAGGRADWPIFASVETDAEPWPRRS